MQIGQNPSGRIHTCEGNEPNLFILYT